MKRSQLKRKTPLRKKSKRESAVLKDDIQALLRAIVIERDGGCVMGKSDRTGACSGPLQADHLRSRANSSTYGDSRNVICLCRRHHIFWKKQNPVLFTTLVREYVGEERWAWIERALADQGAHRMTSYDWGKVALGLRQELDTLKGLGGKPSLSAKSNTSMDETTTAPAEEKKEGEDTPETPAAE